MYKQAFEMYFSTTEILGQLGPLQRLSEENLGMFHTLRFRKKKIEKKQLGLDSLSWKKLWKNSHFTVLKSSVKLAELQVDSSLTYLVTYFISFRILVTILTSYDWTVSFSVVSLIFSCLFFPFYSSLNVSRQSSAQLTVLFWGFFCLLEEKQLNYSWGFLFFQATS